jgi:dihydrofolate reductase
MSRVRVHCFTISVDGYGAGPDQSLENPLGVGGQKLHPWLVATRSWQSEHGESGSGSTGIDDDFVQRAATNIGANILGRNMFGPSRGPWPNDDWKGWWGDNPPYHTPVFVLTHHRRAPIRMEGGTEFIFVNDIHRALADAKSAAGDKDIRIGGGVSVVRQYLEARLIDEMHFAISPALLGGGEHLLNGIDLPALGYEVAEYVPSSKATHVVVRRG